MIKVEVCVETVHDIVAAQVGGASRVEVCSSLDVGGITPSAGLLRMAVESNLDVRALIRPRGGSFFYDEIEMDVVIRDIHFARSFGVEGVVIGASNNDGCLDRDALARLVDASKTVGRTLHRAFDLTPDPFESLEIAIELGFDRILTSGQATNAVEGAMLMSALIEAARGRIIILAGGGINAVNVGRLLETAPLSEVHASCRRDSNSSPDAKPDRLGFGLPPRGTDPVAVADLVSAVATAHRRHHTFLG